MFNLKGGKNTSLPNVKIELPMYSLALDAGTWTSATTAKLNDLAQGTNEVSIWNTGATAGRTYRYVNATIGWKYTNWDG